MPNDVGVCGPTHLRSGYRRSEGGATDEASAHAAVKGSGLVRLRSVGAGLAAPRPLGPGPPGGVHHRRKRPQAGTAARRHDREMLTTSHPESLHPHKSGGRLQIHASAGLASPDPSMARIARPTGQRPPPRCRGARSPTGGPGGSSRASPQWRRPGPRGAGGSSCPCSILALCRHLARRGPSPRGPCREGRRPDPVSLHAPPPVSAVAGALPRSCDPVADRRPVEQEAPDKQRFHERGAAMGRPQGRASRGGPAAGAVPKTEEATPIRCPDAACGTHHLQRAVTLIHRSKLPRRPASSVRSPCQARPKRESNGRSGSSSVAVALPAKAVTTRREPRSPGLALRAARARRPPQARHGGSGAASELSLTPVGSGTRRLWSPGTISGPAPSRRTVVPGALAHPRSGPSRASGQSSRGRRRIEALPGSSDGRHRRCAGPPSPSRRMRSVQRRIGWSRQGAKDGERVARPKRPFGHGPPSVRCGARPSPSAAAPPRARGATAPRRPRRHGPGTSRASAAPRRP